MNDILKNKLSRLKKILLELNSVLIAFSGGLDSTFLLKIAKSVLEDNVLAVTAYSTTYPKKELEEAKKIAKDFKTRFLIIQTNELKNKNFIKNPHNRCYFCKHELFSNLNRIAKKNKIKHIVDGSNLDDLADIRPGTKAKKKFKVRSPLQEAGLTKSEIRILSKQYRLKTWSKPNLACLASRFPYGDSINKKDLIKIDKAEEFLRTLGFKQVRVRHYNNLCRIELENKEIKRLIGACLGDKVVAKFKELGYTYITLDLEGYRVGSMNLVLPRR